MKFAVITHVQHIENADAYYAYGPYVKEMNVWAKYIDQLYVVAPLHKGTATPIDLKYEINAVDFFPISSFSLASPMEILRTFFKLPGILFMIYKVMRQADHIHLRCPGNIGLLGCLVQIFFPGKPKTAKYAGNWDPKSKQPFSYRLQKKILNNTFLTKNMNVLVYGEWEGTSKNIVPFFTASYRESEKEPIEIRSITCTEEHKAPVKFLFVGTLAQGKRPLYAVELIEKLLKKGYPVHLDLMGEGAEREKLENYIKLKDIQKYVHLKGNQDATAVKEAYKQSHFLILPSKSEGWPKVVAEAMFWGAVPLVTPVSCVSTMLNKEERGVLLDLNLEHDVSKIEKIILSPELYFHKAENALNWSRNYTLDSFEEEIKKMIQVKIN
ncbi:glycosyltransferase family 4 protein [Flavobacterium sp. SM15]|uniref:glycosyltransferase family 4 protein n=1 Tax=Flavobacterium sp. SM15 TaxID=2908005 RepID=UPI001ED9C774|nr:glycosyltransferase family 4 protein [Flavobacterium sp. SM15]MCG2611247.1 glycosyltransferase family 4 protein [Flavobacterium sp. SM15]